eukprot:2408838-Pyramimonas_sp.AAC.1
MASAQRGSACWWCRSSPAPLRRQEHSSSQARDPWPQDQVRPAGAFALARGLLCTWPGLGLCGMRCFVQDRAEARS